jgi:Family of unknown function (DUF6510)
MLAHDGGPSDSGDERDDEAFAPVTDDVELLLRRAFGADLTSAQHTCEECGEISAFASHLVFRSHGLILRCPGCEAVAAVAVEQPHRFVVRLNGLWTINKHEKP